ncbi:unnamed protein product, partial [marine sediment metagenome]
ITVEQQNSMLIEDTLKINLPTILNTKEINSYSDYHYLKKALKEIYDTMKTVKEETELNNFFKEGKTFDTAQLKKLYKERNLKKKFPKFSIDKFIHYIENPILEVENYCGEIIHYDPFWVKKNMIACIQMIYNEMDLYILNIGKEGSGKSCWSSQQILYLYNLFSKVGLIEYSYDVQKMFFIDIVSFLEEHSNQQKNEFFRIECLDEGNELNRGNHQDENTKQFKYEMRTERKNLRVILINMQQVGEMDTAVSLSRVNFIY